MPLAASRVGGIPDLPADIAWPRYGRVPPANDWRLLLQVDSDG